MDRVGERVNAGPLKKGIRGLGLRLGYKRLRVTVRKLGLGLGSELGLGTRPPKHDPEHDTKHGGVARICARLNP